MRLDVNQPIVVASDFLGKNAKYNGTINKIESDFITIKIKSDNLTFSVGTPLKIIFWDLDSIYFFETISLLPKQKDNFYINIQKPSSVAKSFKRSFKRVTVKISATIKNLDTHTSSQYIIQDLSAGGAKAIGPEGLKVGNPIKISFTLPDQESFEEVGGLIIRAIPAQQGFVEYGVEFTLLSQIRKQKLNNFIIQFSLAQEKDE